MRSGAILSLAILCAAPAFADTFSVNVPAGPAAPPQAYFMGEGPASTTPTPGSKSPTGAVISFDRYSLLKDGKPWVPVMGEFHYSRYPAAEWRDELLKMKAGGITLVSTYVFWIHHEEEQGKFTWDGDKNLREFVRLCGDVGLPVIVRVGPWCHGEVRNGGFPDWVQSMPKKRTNDPTYLAAVKPLFDQIGQQLKGQLFKDGGPVVGIQLENEFKGPAAHLATLKQMAREAGMDVPIYTRTAWDNASDIAAFGTVLPLWGGYAEGFWDRQLTSMPGNYWNVFKFGIDRAPTASMGDPNNAAATARGETLAYPYLTCELGGGMMSSYHRRINVNAIDAYSLALVKVGSGSNLPGYYMYHGGTNPDGKLTDMLQETQSRGMWNDMPYKNYDFQAPLGACGEVRDTYHLLRELHLFLADYGDTLARMPVTFPANLNAITKTDTTDLRWSVRSDGKSAFIFVNNYQRGSDLPAKRDVQFSLNLASETIKLLPITVPANDAFFFPLNFDLGGATLARALAQPLCKIVDGNTTTTFFKQINGVDASFLIRPGATLESSTSDVFTARGDSPDAGLTLVMSSKPSRTPLIRTHTADGKKQVIVLLDEKDALRLYKFTAAGKQHAALSEGAVAADGNLLHTWNSPVMYITPPAAFTFPNGGQTLEAQPANTIWSEVRLWAVPASAPGAPATVEQIKPAGPLRTIKKAASTQGTTEMPADADWDNAAVFRIKLPADVAGKTRTILRLPYTGDVARVYLDGKLLVDDYYNGVPLDVALWRYPDIATKELLVKILPLQKDAPIYLAKWPDMGNAASIAELKSAELVRQEFATIEVK